MLFVWYSRMRGSRACRSASARSWPTTSAPSLRHPPFPPPSMTTSIPLPPMAYSRTARAWICSTSAVHPRHPKLTSWLPCGTGINSSMSFGSAGPAFSSAPMILSISSIASFSFDERSPARTCSPNAVNAWTSACTFGFRATGTGSLIGATERTRPMITSNSSSSTRLSGFSPVRLKTRNAAIGHRRRPMTVPMSPTRVSAVLTLERPEQTGRLPSSRASNPSHETLVEATNVRTSNGPWPDRAHRTIR